MAESAATFTFHPDTADYPAEAALRRFPDALSPDGTDTNAAARAAYAEGLADGLRIATP